MNKFKLPMNLQFFAEGDGGDGNQSGASGAPRNVSAEQFNSLANNVGSLGSMFEAFMNQPLSDPASSASEPAGSSAPASSTGSSSSIPADWQKKFDDQQKVIESLTATQSANSAATTRASLTNFAQSTAKANGIELGSVVDRMVGKDEEETKSNVEAFVKTVKANTQSNDNGFHLTGTNDNTPKDYIKGFIDRKFGATNKK